MDKKKDEKELNFADYGDPEFQYTLEELAEIYKRIFQDLESDKN